MAIRGRVAVTEGDFPTLEYRIAVSIAGPGRDAPGWAFRELETVIDTGFTGWLALPLPIIRELGLTQHGRRTAVLANGQRNSFDIYGAVISWHGRVIPIPIHQVDGAPLLGMRLLLNCRFTADNRQGGDLIIEELPPEQPRRH